MKRTANKQKPDKHFRYWYYQAKNTKVELKNINREQEGLEMNETRLLEMKKIQQVD